MLYRGTGADGHTGDHEGFVAGRYRDESCSDIWTDVSRCAPHTFVSYLAACTCGWRGPERPSTPAGYHACQRAWITRHFAAVVAPDHRGRPGNRLPAEFGDADFDWGGGLQRLRDAHAWAEAGRASL